jgi:hypothetical protein
MLLLPHGIPTLLLPHGIPTSWSLDIFDLTEWIHGKLIESHCAIQPANVLVVGYFALPKSITLKNRKAAPGIPDSHPDHSRRIVMAAAGISPTAR